MLKGIVNGVPKDITRIPMKGKNLFDLSTATNEFINSNGSITPSSASDPYYLSDYISADNVTISVQYKETAVAEIFTVGVYDSDKRFIRRDAISNNSASYENVAYIRINYRDKNCQNVMLNLGSTPLPYEPYGYQEGWEVRKGDGTLIWGRNDTISVDSGTLPIKGYGVPLKVVEVDGNMTQTGAPDPTTPIWPDETGERTGNLFPLDTNKLHVGRIENDGTIGYKVGTITVGTNSVTYQADVTWRGFYTDFIQTNENENLTFSRFNSSTISLSCSCYDENDSFLGKATAQSTASTRTFTMLAGTKKVRISVTGSLTEYTITNPMLNTGSTPLPYEPYGYKLGISNAGQTTPIYLGQTQTVRRIKKLVLTGEETTWKKSGSANNTFYFNVPGYLRERINITICSHYSSQNNINGAVELQNGKVAFYANAGQPVKYFYVRDSNLATIGDLTAYLAAQYAAGTPVTVWYVLAEPETGIVNEPIRKIGTYADTLTVTDQDVTITPAVGNDTLSIDTTLPPSKISLTGHIKALT